VLTDRTPAVVPLAPPPPFGPFDGRDGRGDADAGNGRVLRTTDLHAAEARACELFGRTRVTPRERRTGGDGALLRSLRVGRVLLAEIAYGVPVEVVSEAAKDVVVAQTVLAGRLRHGARDDAPTHAAGATLVSVPGDPFRIGLDAACSRFCVIVGRDLLPGLDPREQPRGGVVRPACGAEPAADPADRWHALVAFLRAETALRTRGATASPVDDAQIEEWILARLLDWWVAPTVAPVDPAAPPAWLPRAIAYVEAHAGEPIGAVEIARHCAVSPRTVHHAFRDHLDTTPLQFVDDRRLTGRRALAERDRHGLPVH
jgi:hypothetical protein